MVTSAPAAPRPDDSSRFQQHWLAETIRLRESQWGPLQDSNETRRARALGDDFAQRLLLRASYLGRREGTDSLIRSWTRGARLAFIALVVLALLTGATAAVGALGDGTRPVNIMLALTALLGLHALTFLFWCIGSLLPYGGSHTGLGDLWLWLTRKLARGPDTALVPRALLGMLGRHKALRPLLGAISHALWSAALAAMGLTLVALLSARRYAFNWETTLLSPDTFVALTRALGWLPSKLGFEIPTEAMIRASDGLQALPDHAQTLWSSWLIGCLVCYGLLPRVLALLFTLLQTKRRVKSLSLDTRLPGYIELRDRLDPPSLPGGIDAPAPAPKYRSRQNDVSTRVSGRLALVGLELAPETAWPPIALTGSITDLGVIDARPQRQKLLDSLYAHPPSRLLIVCDASQTPDRGVISMITELSDIVEQTRVLLLTDVHTKASHSAENSNVPEQGSVTESGNRTEQGNLAERRTLWVQQLKKAGLPAENVDTDRTPAMNWLATPAVDASASNAACGDAP